MAATMAQLRYDVRSFLGSYPLLYLPLIKLRRRYRGRGVNDLVNPNTELLIEGFPRSGNTFTLAAFQHAQRRPHSIAHHRHVASHVIEAVRLNVPTLVLVRRPEDAVVALARMDPRLSLHQILRSYVRFHRSILPCVEKFVVGTFEEATTDLGAIIVRVNERFGTDFEPFHHTAENVADVFSSLRTIAYQRIPTRADVGTIPERLKSRDAERAALQKQFDALRSSASFAAAQALFDRFAAHAARDRGRGD